MKFLLHRFAFHPVLPTSYKEAAKEKTPPKSHLISQNFSFFRDIKIGDDCARNHFADEHTVG
jgi:hypothetical protein